jgi:septal ring factor EnvC (AmiA/AmiB activator)
MVIVDHENSIFSIYGLLDKVYVKNDDKISKGTTIAKLGASNNSALYFEIRLNNTPENPLLWLYKK